MSYQHPGSSNDLPDGYDPNLAARIKSMVYSETSLSLPESIANHAQIRLISDEVRAGGLGCVGRYWDDQLEREVAVKFINPNVNDSYQQRFQREITITSSLDHPGVVPIYNIGDCEGSPYYTMRFVSGETFAEAARAFHRSSDNSIRRDNPRFRGLLESFKSACATIGYAHREKSVWHRDIKPQNMMIENGLTVVLDWGLAKQAKCDLRRQPDEPLSSHSQSVTSLPPTSQEPDDSADSDLTQADQYLGSPAYMAPEQGLGKVDQIDNLTDVYGLGATLFELLTGRAPHHRSDQMAETITLSQTTPRLQTGDQQHAELRDLLRQVATGPTPSAKALNPSVPAELDSICRRAMAFSKQDRYQSPQQIQEDIECWLTHSNVSAHRYNHRERILGWIRNHSGTTAVALAALLLVATVSIVSYLLVADAKHRTDIALTQIRTERAARLDDLLNIYVSATPIQAEVLLDELDSYSVFEIERGIAALNDSRESANLNRRLRLIHLDEHPTALVELLDQSTNLAAGELKLIASAIHDHRLYLDQQIIEWLWKEFETPESRIKTTAMLARLVPDDVRWRATGPRLAEQLVQVEQPPIKQWASLFAGVRQWLKEPLLVWYQSDSSAVSAAREISARLLLEFFQNDPQSLVMLIGDAEEPMLDAILERLQATNANAGELIGRIVSADRHSKPFRGDSDLAKLVDHANGLITDSFVVCDSMPHSDFKPFVEQLRALGYRPHQVQPYQLAADRFVASTWIRDQQPFQIFQRLPGAKAKLWIQQNRPLGWVPQYLSAERVGGQNLYTLVVCQDHADLANYDVLLDNSLADHMPKSRALALRGYQQLSYLELFDETSETIVAGLYRNDPVQFNQSSKAALLENIEDQDLLRLADYVPLSLNRGPRGLTGVWIDESSLEGRVVADNGDANRLTIWKSLAEDGFVPVEVAIPDHSNSDSSGSYSIWHRPAINANALANYALALCRLGDDELTVKWLARSPDPTLRTLLIHRLVEDAIDPARLVTWLQSSVDPGVRAAIIQALGHYPAAEFREADFESTVKLLQIAHADDADSEVHSSAEWTLGKWGRTGNASPPATGADPAKNWVVDVSGQTMAVVTGPVRFEMGSRVRPRPSAAKENRHTRLIDRSFAIATHEVTWEQYAAFAEIMPPGFTRHYSQLNNGQPNPHAPQYQVSWYRAVEYCNWLSQQADLPKSEWCYLPNEAGQYGPGMKVADHFLDRTGYRLPTEAEWEYAARGGTKTPRFFGRADNLLPAYGWYKTNSNISTHSVGSLKPNQFGLFDVYGNVWEWCHGSRDDPWPDYFDQVEDRPGSLPLTNQYPRILRGGAIVNSPGLLRSSMRSFNKPSNEQFTIGFRVARTVKTGDSTVTPDQ